jgi:hypothetical protein
MEQALVDAESAAFLGNCSAHLIDQVSVEGASICKWGVEDCGTPNQEAVNAFGLGEGRNPKSGVMDEIVLSLLNVLRNPLLGNWISDIE